MPFRSEATQLRMTKAGKEEGFHRADEEALGRVRSGLGAHLPLYIGEEEVRTGSEVGRVSPVDGRLVLAHLQTADGRHVDMAVAAAQEAFAGWSSLDYRKRVATMLRAADMMATRKFELAALMTLDNGKTRSEAVGDVDEAIDYLRYYSEEMVRNRGYTRNIRGVYPGERVKGVLRPLGVWGILAPFNFPLAITVGMTVGALVTGNTAVLKPASDSPLPAVEFYRTMREAGLPAGVLNLVTGSGKSVGRPLVEHPGVAGIAFTGSFAVGSRAYLDFSRSGPRPFISEMGGKNAAIVTGKADLTKAAEGVAKGAFGYGGQKCSATSRAIVFREVKEEFTEELVRRASKLKLGDPARRETFLGPVINEAAYAKYAGAVEEARRDGRILLGGRRATEGDMRHGFYVEPTIVDGLPTGHRVTVEELFVPFLSVTEADGLEEAVGLANGVEYGLTAAIFSEDPGEVEYFFEHIQAGVAYVNRSVGATTGAMVGVQPFVGWKHSGSTGKGAGSWYYLPQFMREQARSTYG
ncbi:MAG: aldehyde dehydrogenase family protein [Nitrososphaerota archaeon]|nr:aldehyde dehydrogenase family protein [Nitrososphaerota archaeon]